MSEVNTCIFLAAYKVGLQILGLVHVLLRLSPIGNFIPSIPAGNCLSHLEVVILL